MTFMESIAFTSMLFFVFGTVTNYIYLFSVMPKKHKELDNRWKVNAEINNRGWRDLIKRQQDKSE